MTDIDKVNSIKMMIFRERNVLRTIATRSANSKFVTFSLFPIFGSFFLIFDLKESKWRQPSVGCSL